VIARRKKPPEHISHERWLVSYADFITLLFAFFTTMYAISTVDAQKMGRMVMSVRASFENSLFSAGSDRLTLSQNVDGAAGSSRGSTMIQSIRSSKASATAGLGSPLKELKSSSRPGGSDSPERLLADLRRSVETLVGPEALKDRVRTRMEGRGLVISLGEGGLFDSGSDTLKLGGIALLEVIAGSLVSTDNHVRVEGHTDNVPIHNSRFPSNWELSTARATAVVAHLIDKFGFAPDRLSAGGYAEYRPVASNETLVGRKQNRRVDIVVLHPKYALAEPQVSLTGSSTSK